jgi:trimeric autotransporter adhesin
MSILKKVLTLITILFSINILLNITNTNAAIPNSIGYQGVLRDTSGTPVNNTFDFRVKYYNSLTGGVAVYEEQIVSKPVVGGVFSLQLGTGSVVSGTFAGVNFNNPVFITFNTKLSSAAVYDGEMNPRIPLDSVAYSLNSNNLQGKTVGGLGGIVAFDNTGSITANSLTASGFITAGTGLVQITNVNGTLNSSAINTDYSLTVAGNNLTIKNSIGGGLTTTATGLSLLTTCSNGQTVQWNGTSWGCASTNYTAGTGLSLTGNQFANTLTLANITGTLLESKVAASSSDGYVLTSQSGTSVWAAVPSQGTASNGVTKTVNDYKLGGTLSQNTTITGSGFNITITADANLTGVTTTGTILPQGPYTGNVATGTNLGASNKRWDNAYINSLTLGPASYYINDVSGRLEFRSALSPNPAFVIDPSFGGYLNGNVQVNRQLGYPTPVLTFNENKVLGNDVVGIRAPNSIINSYVLTLPDTFGTSGQTLVTDTFGNLSWSTIAANNYTASNGLTLASNDINLGGTLNQTTAINLANNSLSFSGGNALNNASFTLDPSGTAASAFFGVTSNGQASTIFLDNNIKFATNGINRIQLDSVGDVRLNSYSNTRNDGITPINILSTDASGYITSTPIASLINNNSWNLVGNSGTDGGINNFIGTTDASNLSFRTNNIEQLNLTQTGRVRFVNPLNNLFLNGGSESTNGNNNIGLGTNSLLSNTNGAANIAIGQNSLSNNTTGFSNVAIGQSALLLNTIGKTNTAIGQAAGLQSTGDNNTFVGYSSASNQTVGNNNIAIGQQVQLTNLTGSNQLNIGNWIYGTNGLIGVNNISPTEYLDVVGNIKLTGSLNPAGISGNIGQVLISQGSGVAPTWIAPTSLGNNFATANLTATGNRIHDFNGFDLTVNNINNQTTLVNGAGSSQYGNGFFIYNNNPSADGIISSEGNLYLDAAQGHTLYLRSQGIGAAVNIIGENSINLNTFGGINNNSITYGITTSALNFNISGDTTFVTQPPSENNLESTVLALNSSGILKRTNLSSLAGNNFATGDLTATGNRIHDFAGKDLTINNARILQLNSTSSAGLYSPQVDLYAKDQLNLVSNTGAGNLNITATGALQLNASNIQWYGANTNNLSPKVLTFDPSNSKLEVRDVSTIGGVSSITASNGLILASNDIALGGTLSQNTIISLNSKEFTFEDNNANPILQLFGGLNGTDYGLISTTRANDSFNSAYNSLLCNSTVNCNSSFGGNSLYGFKYLNSISTPAEFGLVSMNNDGIRDYAGLQSYFGKAGTNDYILSTTFAGAEDPSQSTLIHSITNAHDSGLTLTSTQNELFTGLTIVGIENRFSVITDASKSALTAYSNSLGTNNSVSASISNAELRSSDLVNNKYVSLELQRYATTGSPTIYIGSELGGYYLPRVDGTIGQVITTDGAGGLTWQGSASGPITVQNGNTLLSSGISFVPTTSANNSIFLGYAAGHNADQSNFSNFIGAYAGYGNQFNSGIATSASNSNFFGNAAGYGAAKANNSIFIGDNSGFDDTVNNTGSGVSSDSSILIGNYSSTGGFSNSIALGANAINTKTNQFTIGNSYTNLRIGGVEYTVPTGQGTAGQVLTNDGTGVLSWASAPSSTQLTVGSINSQTKSLDGAVINSNNLVLQTADATYPGLISTTAQMISGSKSFNSNTTYFTPSSKYFIDNGTGLTATSNNILNLSTSGSGFTQILGGPLMVSSGTINNNSGGIALVPNGNLALVPNGNILAWRNIEYRSGAEARFFDTAGSGVNYVGFKSPISAVTSNTIWTLPNSDGTNGQVLTTNGTGALSFTTSAGGSSAISALTAASVNNNINNANFAQTWNWQLTGATNALNIKENAPSSGTGYLFNIETLTSSTAKPFGVTAQSYNVFDIINSGAISIGNSTANTPITFVSGTGAINQNTTGGNFTINTAGGPINIGSDTNTQNANFGTGNGSKNVVIGSNTAFSALELKAGTGNININGTAVMRSAKELRFNNTANTFYTSLRGGANTSNVLLTLPITVGTSGQVLTTNGSGVLSWSTISGAGCVPSGTGVNNTCVGTNALFSNTTGFQNTALGNAAQQYNTTGFWNVAVGDSSLQNNLTGNSNVAVGSEALKQYTLSNATGVGNQALKANTTGYANTAFGANTLFAVTTGGFNTGIGAAALQSNISGDFNVALGIRAGYAITGSNNITIGSDSDVINSAGSNQLSIGNIIFGTGVNSSSPTTPAGFIGIGESAPSTKLQITSGAVNDSGLRLTNLTSASPTSTGTAIGVDSNGKIITVAGGSGCSNLFSCQGGNTLGGSLVIGTQDANNLEFITNNVTKLYMNVYGQFRTVNANNNFFIDAGANGAPVGVNNFGFGVGALNTLTDSNNNIAFGENALAVLTGNGSTFGGNNIALGKNALKDTNPSTLSSGNNIGIGQSTGQGVNQGDSNVVIGATSLQTSGFSDASYNVVIGTGSFNGLTGGNNIWGNVVIGAQNAITQASGSRNIVIGNGIFLNNSTGDNQLNIGNLIFGNNLDGYSNSVSSGNIGIGTNNTTNRLTVEHLSTDSIAKFTGLSASCIIDTNLGALSCTSDQRLKKNINSLTNTADLINSLRPVTFQWKQGNTDSIRSGFIAQEVETIIPELVTTDKDGFKKLNTSGLIPYLTKAVQEQSGLVKSLESRVTILENNGLVNINNTSSESVRLMNITINSLQTKVNEHDIRIQKLEDENSLLKARLDAIEVVIKGK